jgi:hypothetical protein
MRQLYWAFVAAFVVMVAGFWPTTASSPAPLGPLRILHGSLATLWMAMLVAQSWLAGRRRMIWHQSIGWTSVVVVPALVVTAVFVVRDMLAHSTYFPRDLRLTLAWIDLWSLALFSGLWLAAILYRRRWRLHARFVGCTVFVALIPALGRLLGINIPALGGLDSALHPSYWIVEAILVGLIARDLARRGHPAPYAITLAGLALFEATIFTAPHWGWFVAFCEAIGPIG